MSFRDHIETFREVLTDSELFNPDDENANLIIQFRTGSFVSVLNNPNPNPFETIVIQCRVRNDSNPSIIYQESAPELTVHLIGKAVDPYILPEEYLQGQRYQATLWGRSGMFVLLNKVVNPYGFSNEIGQSILGAFVYAKI
jgi:hypothetical protein